MRQQQLDVLREIIAGDITLSNEYAYVRKPTPEKRFTDVSRSVYALESDGYIKLLPGGIIKVLPKAHDLLRRLEEERMKDANHTGGSGRSGQDNATAPADLTHPGTSPERQARGDDQAATFSSPA